MIPLQEIFEKLIRDDHIVCAERETEGLSYPVPGRAREFIVERFFLFPNLPQSTKPRPYAWFSVDMQSGAMVHFSHCRVEDFAAQLNIPLEMEVDYRPAVGISVREARRKRQEYEDLYAHIREYAFSKELEPEQREQVREYLGLQRDLFQEPLLQFYRMLSPEFYTWTEKQANEANL